MIGCIGTAFAIPEFSDAQKVDGADFIAIGQIISYYDEGKYRFYEISILKQLKNTIADDTIIVRSINEKGFDSHNPYNIFEDGETVLLYLKDYDRGFFESTNFSEKIQDGQLQNAITKINQLVIKTEKHSSEPPSEFEMSSAEIISQESASNFSLDSLKENGFQIYSITEKQVRYNIPYKISNGIVDNMLLNCNDASFMVNINNDNSEGKLVLAIPKSMLDSNNEDEPFFVLIDGKEVDFDENKNPDYRELEIPFPSNAKQIEIIHTWIPEWPKPDICEIVHNPPYSYIIPPLKQLESVNDVNDIICKNGFVLIQKYDDSPACVKTETKAKLMQRGWGVDDIMQQLVDGADRILTGMVTNVEQYDNGKKDVFIEVYEWLKNGTNTGAFLEIGNPKTSTIEFTPGEEVLLFLRDIDETRGARDLYFTNGINPAKYPIFLRDHVFAMIPPQNRGMQQISYYFNENCSEKDLDGDSYMHCTFEERDTRFYVPINTTAILVRDKMLEHISEKYFQEHFDLVRAYDNAVVNGHATPTGQNLEFVYKIDDMRFLYFVEVYLNNSEVYIRYVIPKEIQTFHTENMNESIKSCFKPGTYIISWDKVIALRIDHGFSPVITGAGPPMVIDRYGDRMQGPENHFRFWPETGEVECSQGMKELPNIIQINQSELLIDSTQFLKIKNQMEQ